MIVGLEHPPRQSVSYQGVSSARHSSFYCSLELSYRIRDIAIKQNLRIDEVIDSLLDAGRDQVAFDTALVEGLVDLDHTDHRAYMSYRPKFNTVLYAQEQKDQLRQAGQPVPSTDTIIATAIAIGMIRLYPQVASNLTVNIEARLELTVTEILQVMEHARAMRGGLKGAYSALIRQGLQAQQSIK